MKIDDYVIDSLLWQSGLALEEYVDQMGEQRAAMVRRLDEVSLAADDVRFFEGCKRPRYVVAMTEDWCGDSLMNLPIVARIVEVVPEMEMRVFVRSKAAELSRFYEERVSATSRCLRSWTALSGRLERGWSVRRRRTTGSKRGRRSVPRSPNCMATLR